MNPHDTLFDSQVKAMRESLESMNVKYGEDTVNKAFRGIAKSRETMIEGAKKEKEDWKK